MELDPGRRELRRSGMPVKLPKLSFNLLLALAEAAPNLLTHDELIDRVWGKDRVISPENLSQRVKMLRESLGDSANAPDYIEVVRGQGFRLIPEVIALDPAVPVDSAETAATAIETAQPGVNRPLWVGAAAILLAAVLFWSFYSKDPIRQPSTQDDGSNWKSVAVLPFSNLSPDPEYGYYASGIHEEVLNQLAKLAGLRVISRTSVLRYQDTQESIPAIARDLNVDSLVEGSVRYADNRIRVTIQLVDGTSDEHLWSETYDRELKSIFEIESDIARDVAARLTKLAAQDLNGRSKQAPTDNLEAYALYVQAQKATILRRPDQLRAALEQFREATRLDPNYVQAWVGIANTLSWLGIYTGMEKRITFTERQAAIDRALALDPASAEAWLAQGSLRNHQFQPEEAEEYYLRGIELAPGVARGYHWYGLFLFNQGRREEALAQIRKAVELDPLSPSINGVLARVLWALGRVEESLFTARKIIALEPGYAIAYDNIADKLAELGRLDEAAYTRYQAIALAPDAWRVGYMHCEDLLALGDDTAAEACHQNITTEFPDVVDVQDFWHLYLFRGQYNLFLEDMEEQVVKYPTSIVFRRLAYAQAVSGKLESAREILSGMFPQYFEGNLESFSKADLYYGVLCGVVLFHLGEETQANLLFDRALEVMKSMHRTRGEGYQQADILIHATRGDHDAAIAALRQAIDSGWRKNWWMLRLPALASIQHNTEWQSLIAELEADIARQRENYQAHKDDKDYWL